MGRRVLYYESDDSGGDDYFADGDGGWCGMAFGAKAAIEHFRPLLTVDIQGQWIGLAVAVGVLGGLLSAIYPGYCALRQDPLEALGYE